MKGIIFTMDMLIGMTIVLILLTFLPLKSETNYPEFTFQTLTYTANDLMNILTTLKVKDVKEKPTISRLLRQGLIKEADLEKSVLDLIGSFWYADNKSIATNITKEILENLTENYCFNLSTMGETIYSSCNSSSNIVATSSSILSGYEIGKPSSGYIARAWVRKVVKNSTQIIPFYPEGSGWTARRLEVTKKFSLNPNMTILNATLFVSVHFGTDKAQAQFEQLKVNGVEKKTDITWLYLEEASVGSEITTAAYGVVDVTQELVPGNNTIYLVIGSPNYHSHLHPGMRLVIVYSLIQELKESGKIFRKRYYFDDVIGRTGAWSTLSFFIPENAKNVSAILHLKAKEVDDTRVFGLDATDVKIYINSDEPFYEDGVVEFCYSISNYYCERDIVGEMNPEYTFDITNQLVNGTNIVSVFLNSYGDLHWGNGLSEIYSDPLADPDDSSYVEVSYELEHSPLKYGEIDITVENLFGGEATNPKTYDFNISEGRKDIIESFAHIAQGFSSMLEAYAWYDNEDKNLVFKSPAPRATPESVYISPSIWGVGENHIELRDVQPGGSLSPLNTFLPWSSFEYTYKIKAIVGYGDVFNTSQEAVDDAIQRLLEQVGEEGISAQNIQVDTKSVYGIEWLWGPASFEISVWKR